MLISHPAISTNIYQSRSPSILLLELNAEHVRLTAVGRCPSKSKANTRGKKRTKPGSGSNGTLNACSRLSCALPYKSRPIYESMVFIWRDRLNGTSQIGLCGLILQQEETVSQSLRFLGLVISSPFLTACHTFSEYSIGVDRDTNGRGLSRLELA